MLDAQKANVQTLAPNSVPQLLTYKERYVSKPEGIKLRFRQCDNEERNAMLDFMRDVDFEATVE